MVGGFEVLKLFAELCEELSHRGRSSLTVVSGAVDDLAAGHALSADELQDALQGTERLCRTLDVLRELGRMVPEVVPDTTAALRGELARLLASVKQ